jgi:hypothetical protein
VSGHLGELNNMCTLSWQGRQVLSSIEMGKTCWIVRKRVTPPGSRYALQFGMQLHCDHNNAQQLISRRSCMLQFRVTHKQRQLTTVISR